MRLKHGIKATATALIAISTAFANPMGKGLYFDANSSQYFINDKASFSIKSLEGDKFVDQIELSIDNKPYEKYSGKVRFEKEGFHILRFKAVDPVLNWSPVESFRIYVDMSSPKTHLSWSGDTYQNDGKFFISPRSKLSLTAYDNLSGVSSIFIKNGEEGKIQKYNKPRNFKNAGEYNIRVMAKDQVGNSEPWQNVSFFVDNAAPTSKAIVKGNSYQKDSKLYIDKGSFITLEAKDENSGLKEVQYSLNNGPVKTYKENISVEKSITSLKYRAIDRVGNAEPWKTITVHLDAAPPKIWSKNNGQFKKLAGKYFVRPGFKVQVGIVDKESGSKNLVVDNGDAQNISTKEFTFKDEGKFDFYVRGEDKVGNVSNTVFYSVFVDNKSPKSELATTRPLVEKDGVFLSSLPNKVKLSAMDEGVGVKRIEASFDKKEIFPVTAPLDLATWKIAKRKLYYRAVDHLGNAEPWQEKFIHVRNRGPKVDLFVEAGNLPEVPLSKLNKMYKNGKKSSSLERNLASEQSPKKKIKKDKKKKYKKKGKKKKRKFKKAKKKKKKKIRKKTKRARKKATK